MQGRLTTYHSGKIHQDRNPPALQFFTRPDAAQLEELGRVESTRCKDDLLLRRDGAQLSRLLGVISLVCLIQALADHILHSIGYRILTSLTLTLSIFKQNPSGKRVCAERQAISLVDRVHYVRPCARSPTAASDRDYILVYTGSVMIVCMVDVASHELNLVLSVAYFDTGELELELSKDSRDIRGVYGVANVVATRLGRVSARLYTRKARRRRTNGQTYRDEAVKAVVWRARRQVGAILQVNEVVEHGSCVPGFVACEVGNEFPL